MNLLSSRMLKSAYRKEPISSFIITVGAVDAVIGGVGDRLSLMLLGVGVVGVAIAFRWWKIRQSKTEFSSGAPIHYLPGHSSRPQLPTLSVSSKKPSRRT
ncbi:MAG: hypothetical protein HC899_03375 [Leptolyngbyaceae cyanobacterium SM1_4_3]|nr:hypothetical protein [Leptolyngbyaceae cyanobacterium SM1_4_3]NJN91575.1 hypothetical protein [Leptolyngbyaceae cyanobacterium SL_5_14]